MQEYQNAGKWSGTLLRLEKLNVGLNEAYKCLYTGVIYFSHHLEICTEKCHAAILKVHVDMQCSVNSLTKTDYNILVD